MKIILWIESHWLKCLTWMLIGIVISAFFHKCTGGVSEVAVNRFEPKITIDSIKKAYKLPKVVANNIPVKRKIYIKKDTVLRDTLKKKDRIIFIAEKPGETDIDLMDTLGNVRREIHKIDTDETKEITIGPSGEVETKERTKVGKFLIKAKKKAVTGLAVVGATAIVVVVFLLAGGN